jgi:hypothetical protein
VEIRPVDPRDVRWEISEPTFRVYFWKLQGFEISSGYESSEFEVNDADVVEVLTWADATAGDGQTYTLDVLVPTGSELGSIRLAGRDPTER